MDYKKAGVNIDAAEKWVDLIKEGEEENGQKNLLSKMGEYAAVYQCSEEQLLATGCDGIGTKLLWSLQGYGAAEGAAQDLMGMNVNDLLCVGAVPRLFLDYIAFSSEQLLENGAFLGRFIKELQKQCLSHGMILAGGETAQMKDLYGENELDVAGFTIGFMSPSEYLNPKNISLTAEIWAWPSSGPHSNGYTLLRKIFTDETQIRNFLMKPTKLYVNEMAALKAYFCEVGQSESLQAAYHITGGGWMNLLRAHAADRKIAFDLLEWPEEHPEWVNLILNQSDLNIDDLYKIFNMGYGMAVFIENGSAQHSDALEQLGLVKLGKVVEDNRYVRINNVILRESVGDEP